jgi:hypothetical protein
MADVIDIYEPTVQKIWEARLLTTLCASMVCYRESFYLLPDLDFEKKGIFIALCSKRVSQYTATASLYNINRLGFVAET